jgi:asparagine synthase (glutamine-hydrolysing)
MCGICGIYNLDPLREVEERGLKAMVRILSHRGPDDEGFFREGNIGLGHRRLSIIDLSPAAQQPMWDEHGRYCIVYNGEIYNYLELRQQLVSRGHTFRSHSDTETVLHLYEEEGPECVSRLNGMFALAIWDRQERTLFAARDRFGIKPFYFTFQRGAFWFASEVKCFFQIPGLEARLNPRGLADYLDFQFCFQEKTLFQNVFKLLPGHILLLGPDGALQTRKYWDLDFQVDPSRSEAYFEHHLLRLLEDAVRLQLRADVPVGAHLSGGLDSSALAVMASSLMDTPIHTFSGGFREGPAYDETSYARAVAQKIGSFHHEVFPTPGDLVDVLPKLIFYMDEPAAGPGLIPQYFVSRMAREKVKVVIGGQGGDEIFGGYIRYLIAYLEECLRGGIEGTQNSEKYIVTFESILPNLKQLQGYQPLLRYFWQEGLFEAPDLRYFRLIQRGEGVREWIAPEAYQDLAYSPLETYRALFNEGETHSLINRMTRFDLKTLLPALLQVEDRTSMAVSLESRVPLLDHRIVELVASMPPRVKYKGGRSKHIFRQVVQHLVPEEISSRVDKMGFPVPLFEWVGRNPVREFVHDTLTSSRAKNRGILQAGAAEKVLASEKAYGRSLWGLLCLELWMEIFVDGLVPVKSPD